MRKSVIALSLTALLAVGSISTAFAEPPVIEQEDGKKCKKKKGCCKKSKKKSCCKKGNTECKKKAETPAE